MPDSGLPRVQQNGSPRDPKNCQNSMPDQWAAQGAAKWVPAAPKIAKTGCASTEGGYIHYNYPWILPYGHDHLAWSYPICGYVTTLTPLLGHTFKVHSIRVRVALVGIIADHPAMCKLCGFPTIVTTLLPAQNARQLAEEYRNLGTQAENDAFFATHGVHWSVAKTQWYQRWIKAGALRANTSNFFRELNVIHEFLESFEAPLWAGRLPLRVGEPSGGSLTADEYKCAVTAPWAIMIPIVWDKFLAEAEKEHTISLETYRQAMHTYRTTLRAWESGNRKPKQPAEPKKPILRMQAGEDVNLLRFATLLKILVGSSITEDGLDKSENLLQKYLLGFLTPNHHWAVHIPRQVRDFGPLYSFWAFVTERLNKVLKNLKSNNWPGGRLEVSMVREFQRMSRLDGLLS
ncbi:hypothetical protein GGX14DRAFT_408397 [Mycena pura]|uniref:Uncharacterized protein n=1 Tax=Mycena pura TaxID=153505 RepID=A0AAD6Y3F4_9AGAR|nr:hypothetical protein GGX14DRAFT_408397 [Mycena pura]